MNKKEYDRQYYINNKDRITKQNREYCIKNQSNVDAYKKIWYKENKARILDRNRLRNYGMSDDTYMDILFEQDGVCAICEQVCVTKKKLGVDHDHSCCPVTPTCGNCNRGLLCQYCNTALGGFRDSRSILQKADGYLGKYESM